MPIPARWFRWIVVPPLAAYWIVLFVLTHTPPPEMPKTHFNDKLAHFLAYALLGTLLHLSFWPGKRSALRALIITVSIALAYGAVDEWTQPLVGRDCDLIDWLSDAAGVICSTGIMTLARLLLLGRRDVAA
jgi:VanZ family protein